jgi:cyclic pyranopterin monophosphate synthase
MTELNHLDADGAVRMVDVGSKAEADRRAVAVARVAMDGSTVDRLFGGDLPKGDALATVRIAAIQGTKATATLIPLCHPIAIDGVEVLIERHARDVTITVEVRVHARTGVEMEAMTGAAVGALTLYDMVKGVDRAAHVSEIALLAKSGGRSGDWVRD